MKNISRYTSRPCRSFDLLVNFRRTTTLQCSVNNFFSSTCSLSLVWCWPPFPSFSIIYVLLHLEWPKVQCWTPSWRSVSAYAYASHNPNGVVNAHTVLVNDIHVFSYKWCEWTFWWLRLCQLDIGAVDIIIFF